jgi:hypothetical protein
MAPLKKEAGPRSGLTYRTLTPFGGNIEARRRTYRTAPQRPHGLVVWTRQGKHIYVKLGTRNHFPAPNPRKGPESREKRYHLAKGPKPRGIRDALILTEITLTTHEKCLYLWPMFDYILIMSMS